MKCGQDEPSTVSVSWWLDFLGSVLTKLIQNHWSTNVILRGNWLSNSKYISQALGSRKQRVTEAKRRKPVIMRRSHQWLYSKVQASSSRIWDYQKSGESRAEFKFSTSQYYSRFDGFLGLKFGLVCWNTFNALFTLEDKSVTTNSKAASLIYHPKPRRGTILQFAKLVHQILQNYCNNY